MSLYFLGATLRRAIHPLAHSLDPTIHVLPRPLVNSATALKRVSSKCVSRKPRLSSSWMPVEIHLQNSEDSGWQLKCSWNQIFTQLHPQEVPLSQKYEVISYIATALCFLTFSETTTNIKMPSTNLRSRKKNTSQQKNQRKRIQRILGCFTGSSFAWERGLDLSLNAEVTHQTSRSWHLSMVPRVGMDPVCWEAKMIHLLF